jgi:hypothetical protein
MRANVQVEERYNSLMIGGNNSMSLHSMAGTNGVPSALNTRKSISAVKSQSNGPKVQKEVKVVMKYESVIFKGYKFYI